MKFRQLAVATVLSIVSFFGATQATKADSVYTVKPGDTLSGISMELNHDLSRINQMAADNNIQDINMIYVGQQLLIKDNGEISQATSSDVQNATPVASVQQAVNNNATSYQQPAQAVNNNYGADSAREWIANHESGGSYTAQNGRYYGKYQLDSSYLNGDYSPANQERVANNYVASRYGSWTGAQQFWQSHGWY
ncbi:LysM peptidoglycan-binding domain-containing protein [Bombilactobacillus folatiphilus]|uniref:LysM peptidoglycan-binding domain-containing protein n=1 Tax=Bombilactobacillus folatiphilus TaxID=2923362 RepID=A0ABY4P8W1_9LACO|nr:LysM peptidoglycan-binding domain-containing protein [Bombilactobacillus folatiphilus]UQS82097.1 LysM peptidoglycan-binding domain-containing protein [Bombilactobacillus folatiphilus]